MIKGPEKCEGQFSGKNITVALLKLQEINDLT